jgi:hypothetical protein
MKTKMTVKKTDTGKGKKTTLKMSDSAASKSAAKYKPTASTSAKAAKSVKNDIGRINPVTGKVMTKADADAKARQLEKKKRS